MLFPDRLSCRRLHQQPADGASLCDGPAHLWPHGPGAGARAHCVDVAHGQQVLEHELLDDAGQDLHGLAYLVLIYLPLFYGSCFKKLDVLTI